MAVDDSFKKPGAVPFKWEIRPGVPKVQQEQKQQEQSPQKRKQQKQKEPPPPLPPPASPFINQLSLLSPPGPPRQQKLKPPPPGSYLLRTPEPRSHSFRWTPRARSERWRFDQPARLPPECVSTGCFPSPLLRRKGSKKRTQKPEPDNVLDLETLSRWSVSSRRSLSPLYSSPASSFSSFRSSPRAMADAEWAGFGLF
ncbi:hypothetical protein DITRI_Ditri05aG0117000 [Diplodiscus trichospermus]